MQATVNIIPSHQYVFSNFFRGPMRLFGLFLVVCFQMVCLFFSGFYDDGYAYFLMVQPVNAENLDEGLVSKIARVCANDPSYESYMEITLNCQHKGNRYTLLQSAYILRPESSKAGFSAGQDKILSSKVSGPILR